MFFVGSSSPSSELWLEPWKKCVVFFKPRERRPALDGLCSLFMVFLYIILSPFSSKNHFFFSFFFWNCEGLAVMVSCVAFPYNAFSSAYVRVLFSCDSFEGPFLLYSFSMCPFSVHACTRPLRLQPLGPAGTPPCYNNCALSHLGHPRGEKSCPRCLSA